MNHISTHGHYATTQMIEAPQYMALDGSRWSTKILEISSFDSIGQDRSNTNTCYILSKKIACDCSSKT